MFFLAEAFSGWIQNDTHGGEPRQAGGLRNPPSWAAWAPSSPTATVTPKLSPLQLQALLSSPSRHWQAVPSRGLPPDPHSLSLEAAGKPPGRRPPTPLTLGHQQWVHLPRTTLPGSSPGGVLLPAPSLPAPPAVQSSPGSAFPAPLPLSCCQPGPLASAPLSLLAPLGPVADSAPGPCFSSAFAPSRLLRFRSGETLPAPFGICFSDLVAGVWGAGPGGSCSPGWAAAGASTGVVGLRLRARVTSSSPGVSVSCTWMEILGQRENTALKARTRESPQTWVQMPTATIQGSRPIGLRFSSRKRDLAVIIIVR